MPAMLMHQETQGELLQQPHTSGDLLAPGSVFVPVPAILLDSFQSYTAVRSIIPSINHETETFGAIALATTNDPSYYTMHHL